MISRSTASAVCGLVMLARTEGRTISLREIVESIRESCHTGCLSEEYVAKLFQSLSKAGIVRSVSGPRGGYRLARAADKVSFWDVACVVQGDPVGGHCEQVATDGSGGSRECRICEAIRSVSMKSRELLRSIKIADVID